MNEQYNGWTNYPTWNVHLWLSNEEGLYYQSREIVLEAENERDACEALREFVEQISIPMGASMTVDIYSWALSVVNWREIVTELREE